MVNLTALMSVRRSNHIGIGPIGDELSVEALAPQLCRVVEEGLEIRFVYRGERRVVRPHVLFRDGYRTYLGGTVPPSHATLSFDIAEMIEIACTGETFTPERRWTPPRGERISIICQA